MGLELKDDLQLPSAQCPADQLMTIPVLLVPANLKISKEALDSFLESQSMLSEFIPLEVVLEIRRGKPTPIDHGSFYRATLPFRIRCRPNARHQPRRLMNTPAAVGCKPMLAGLLSPVSIGACYFASRNAISSRL